MKLGPATALCASFLLLAAGIASSADEPWRAQSQPPAPAPKPVSARALSIETPAPASLYVGLRRSSYGLRKQNGDDGWWLRLAKTYATNFPDRTSTRLNS